MKWDSNLKLGKLLEPEVYACGTLEQADPEATLDEMSFRVHKYNIRPRPGNKNHVVIFSCFSEFGSELVGCLYCLPRMLQTQYLGYYVIVMGWHGREYLYRHLVDEFWELDREHHWLREYCRAYHHSSKNLKRLERAVGKNYGRVVDSNAFSIMTLRDLYVNLEDTKKKACWTPTPGAEAHASVAKFLKSNSVGVTARFRKCYGRNLQIDFYKRLLEELRGMGYDPIWMGEPGTTYECPVPDVTNFRDSPESSDLEKTLALTSGLKFTIQFWTASTRLAGLMGVPFIIFESPDQIYGAGHEGLRLNLTTRGNKKLVISHFWNVYNDNEKGLELARRAISEMKDGDWSDLVGLVESDAIVSNMRTDNIVRVFGE